MSNKIYITEIDAERLEHVLGGTSRSVTIDLLEDELSRAIIVPANEIPADVVTMNSIVRFQDCSTGEEFQYTLTYPSEAKIEEGKVSILAPVGAALLGLSVGDTIEWPMPTGKARTLKLIEVLFQPEAQGRFDL